MELYEKTSYELSRRLTLRYSSSFGMSSRLFDSSIRRHIYAVYGLVRIADEIVDTYTGPDARQQLDELEAQTYAAMKRGYSANPIVHAFGLTAAKYGIDSSLIKPFFASMRMDLTPREYTDAHYERYIYGSAEVIGLMCLRIFCLGDDDQYQLLAPGARALGAAYQKVNFLRDVAADYVELGRMYFPGVTYETFSDESKQAIVTSIETDFAMADSALSKLPRSSKAAVMLSVSYYRQLLYRLKAAPVSVLKTQRLRISTPKKLWLLLLTTLRYGVQG